MATPLYTRDILRLAADSAGLQRLSQPDGVAERRTPVCGSSMIADVTLDASGRIVHLGGEVHACAMGQASAAIVMRHATGRTQADFGAVREALGAYLTGEAETVSWPELSVFAPARGRPARHAAILLPFDATLAAIEAAA